MPTQRRIVAIVNGGPITNLEVEDRIKFIQLVTNIDIAKADQETLKKDALQGIIEDRIKTQEAQKYSSDARAQALNAARNIIEQNFAQNGYKSGA